MSLLNPMQFAGISQPAPPPKPQGSRPSLGQAVEAAKSIGSLLAEA